MGANDLVMYRGDDRPFPMKVAIGGSPINLSGGSVTFTAKANLEDADADAVITLSTVDGSVTIVDGPAGLLRVDIPAIATAALPADTRLVWDLQIETADGKVRTVPEPDPARPTLGTLTIRRRVKRTA